MLCVNNEEPKKKNEEEQTKELFIFSGKKIGAKGTCVYTPQGYGIIQEERNKEGNVLVKIDNNN